jgi:hypothetical protein
VIGIASAAKHAEFRALEVDHLIDCRTEDFETRARRGLGDAATSISGGEGGGTERSDEAACAATS